MTGEKNLDVLEPGHELTAIVEARGGELQEDQLMNFEVEVIGEKNEKAQSRYRSIEVKRKDTGVSAFIRHKTTHKNNFGFAMSHEDKTDVDFDARWQDPITDDRDWKLKDLEL